MYKKLGVVLCLSSMVTTAVFAFEPIPIDEFFKDNPDQVGQAQDFTPTGQNISDGVPVGADVLSESPADKALPAKEKKGEPIVVNPDIVEKVSYKEAEFIVLNRITDKVIKVKLDLGETKLVDGFEIGFRSCNRKVFQDNAIYTVVSFIVKGEPQKTTEEAHKEAPQFFLKKDDSIKPLVELYNNHMYLELPGLNGFEHPIYDIHPLSCHNGVSEIISKPKSDTISQGGSIPSTGIPVESITPNSSVPVGGSTPIPPTSTPAPAASTPAPQTSLPELSPAVNVGSPSTVPQSQPAKPQTPTTIKPMSQPVPMNSSIINQIIQDAETKQSRPSQ